MSYNAMDKPLSVSGRGATTSFVYGSDDMRAKQSRTVGSTTTTTYYVDKYYEADSDGSWRAYLDDIAVLSYTPQRSHLLQFTLRDRLGSATTMADQNGNIVSQRYFDPFGRTASTGGGHRTDIVNKNSLQSKLQDLDITNKNRRGFTDHEHLNEQQLIHMNGRIYDYNLGRFMSVDPFIQSPTSTQSVNPYSYIMNNPLAGTDPTGYCSTGTHIKDNDAIGCTVDFDAGSGGSGKKKSDVKVTSNGNNSYTASFQLDKKTTLEVDFKINNVGSQGAIASGSGVGGYNPDVLIKMGFPPETRFFNDMGDPYLPLGMTYEQHQQAMYNASGIAAVGLTFFIPGPEDILLGVYIASRGAELTAKAVGLARGADVVEDVTKGGTEIVQRWMSKAELKATQETGLLRGGRDGTHYVTDSANSNALRARQRSALPQTPEVKVTLEVPAGKFSPPSRVEPAFNMPGRGMERTATGNIPVTIKRVQ